MESKSWNWLESDSGLLSSSEEMYIFKNVNR